MQALPESLRGRADFAVRSKTKRYVRCMGGLANNSDICGFRVLNGPPRGYWPVLQTFDSGSRQGERLSVEAICVRIKGNSNDSMHCQDTLGKLTIM